MDQWVKMRSLSVSRLTEPSWWRSRSMPVSACLSICLSVCLSVSITQPWPDHRQQIVLLSYHLHLCPLEGSHVQHRQCSNMVPSADDRHVRPSMVALRRVSSSDRGQISHFLPSPRRDGPDVSADKSSLVYSRTSSTHVMGGLCAVFEGCRRVKNRKAHAFIEAFDIHWTA